MFCSHMQGFEQGAKKNSTDPKIKEAKLSYSPTETEQMDENITLFSQENK